MATVDIDSIPAPPKSSIVSVDDLPPPPSPASKTERFARGLLEPVVGLGQLTAHGIAAATDITPEDSAIHKYGDYIRQGNDDRAREYREYSKQIAPDGIDWARIVGQAVPALSAVIAEAPEALAGIGGEGAGLLVRGLVTGGKGALAGTSSSLLQPVDTNEGSFAGQKTAQGVEGGTSGALFGIAGNAVVKGINSVAGNVARVIKSKFPEADGQSILASVADTLKQQGIDFGTLSDDVKQGITNEVKNALFTGKEVNPTQAANKAAFNELGINPTKGQISQDPTQFGKELFLREGQAGAPLATQYQDALRGLSGGLNSLQSILPKPLNTPQAGARVIAPLADAAERGQGLVNRAYDQFKEAAPENFTVNGSQMANKFFEAAEKDPGLRNLPASLSETLNKLSTGKVPSMSLVDADAISREITRQLKGATPAQKYSLNTLKSMLDEQTEDAANGLPGLGKSADDHALTGMQETQETGNVADRLFAARKYAAQRFGMLDSIPAMKAAADGSVSPDDFVKKFVTSPSAKVQDVSNLKDFLMQADPEAFNQIKAQVLSDIRDSATKGKDGKFLQSSYNKEISSLEQSGKLNVLFTPEQVNHLKIIGHVGQLLEGPQGVSRTGLGGAAKLQDGILNIIAKIHPGTAGVLNFLNRTAKNEVDSSAALNPKLGLTTPVTVINPKTQGLLGQISANLLGGGTANAASN